jgi:hypothetical protein
MKSSQFSFVSFISGRYLIMSVVCCAYISFLTFMKKITVSSFKVTAGLMSMRHHMAVHKQEVLII